jgi:type IV secretion system protein TrbL
MDPTVLQRLITGIEAALAPGLAAMRPFLLVWISALIFLEALRIWGAIMEDGHRWHHVVGFLVRTLMFVSVFWGWPTIMSTLVDDFVHAGLRFGGDQMTVQQFLDPGMLLVQGITTAKPLADLVTSNANIGGVGWFLAFLPCWLAYLVAFAIMSCAIFLAQVEFRVLMPVSLVALGFLFWAPTRQMAGGVFSYALNVSFRFFIQAILASLVFRLTPILGAPVLTTRNAFDISMLQAFGMVVGAGVMTFLFLKIPFVVANHLAGTPALSAGGLLQTAAGLVGMATGAGSLLRPRGGGWALRQPRPAALPEGTHARRLQAAPAAARVGPPPIPATQALNATLRSGAQFLGHDHSSGGAHVSL